MFDLVGDAVPAAVALEEPHGGVGADLDDVAGEDRHRRLAGGEMHDLERPRRARIPGHGHDHAALQERGVQRQHGVVGIGEEPADALGARGEHIGERLDANALGADEIGKLRPVDAVGDDDLRAVEAGERIAVGERRQRCRRRLRRRAAPPSASAARRSVYFHASTRRCGSPARSNSAKAASRARARGAVAGQALARRAVFGGERLLGLGAQDAGLGVHIDLAASGRRLGVVGVALLLELERQLLAARADDPARRHDVHEVGHDVVEEPLVVGDDDAPSARASGAR